MTPPGRPEGESLRAGRSSSVIPVITIDGPTASGKGTVASRVAERLGFHYLDSGALYRLVALRALDEGIDPDDPDTTARVAADLAPRFAQGRIRLGERDVTEAIRAEAVGRGASRVAVHAGVRQALVDLQRGFRRTPGLVADGRDMGTVIFPDAALKVFLTATAEQRAERRYKQLIENGFSANLITLLQDLRERDARDIERAAAPLTPAADALPVDSSRLRVADVVDLVLNWWQRSAVANAEVSDREAAERSAGPARPR
jgi:cytidylate kinase